MYKKWQPHKLLPYKNCYLKFLYNCLCLFLFVYKIKAVNTEGLRKYLLPQRWQMDKPSETFATPKSCTTFSTACGWTSVPPQHNNYISRLFFTFKSVHTSPLHPPSLFTLSLSLLFSIALDMYPHNHDHISQRVGISFLKSSVF